MGLEVAKSQACSSEIQIVPKKGNLKRNKDR